MKELSLLEHQHVCTLNTCGYIVHTRNVLGEKAVSALFKGIFDDDGFVVGRTYLGERINIDYFMLPDNWFDNDLNLQFFSNVNDLGLDLVETGKTTVTANLMQKNGVVLGLVQVLGVDKAFNGVNKVNALYNRTKQASVSEITPTSGTLTLNYNHGFVHNAFVTKQNIGAYVAVLQFLGYRNVSFEILHDEPASELNHTGKTVVCFTWQRKTVVERLRFFLASFVSKRLGAPYLRSSRYIHEFHSALVVDYQYQLTRKNQALQALEARYQEQLNAKDSLIAEQSSIIAQQEQQLNGRYIDFGQKLETWFSQCELSQLNSVTQAADAMNVTERSFNRRVQAIYQKTTKQLLKEKLIERSKILLTAHSISDVAMQCGYASVSSFSRAFKSVTGANPTEFKTDLQNEKELLDH